MIGSACRTTVLKRHTFFRLGVAKKNGCALSFAKNMLLAKKNRLRFRLTKFQRCQNPTRKKPVTSCPTGNAMPQYFLSLGALGIIVGARLLIPLLTELEISKFARDQFVRAGPTPGRRLEERVS